MFRFLGGARWVWNIVLNVFEPTYMVPLHIFAVKKTPHFCQLMEMMHVSVRSRTWPGCNDLQRFVSICVPGNGWTDGGKIHQLILEDPRRSVRHCNCSRGYCFVAGKMCQVASRQFITGSILYFLLYHVPCCFHVKQQIWVKQQMLANCMLFTCCSLKSQVEKISSSILKQDGSR